MLPARPLPTTQQDGRVQERPISRRRLAAGTKITKKDDRRDFGRRARPGPATGITISDKSVIGK